MLLRHGKERSMKSQLRWFAVVCFAGLAGTLLRGQVNIATVEDLHAIRNGLTSSYRLTNDIDAAVTAQWNALVDCGAWNATTDYERIDPLSHAWVQHLSTNYYAIINSGPGYEGPVEPGVATNWATRWMATTLLAGHNLGFEPIGFSYNVSFRGVFDGGGHTITNLTINRPETQYVGLFGYVLNNKARVYDLTLAGSVVGGTCVGMLAGQLTYGPLCSNIVVHANVRGDTSIGGLVGSTDGGFVQCCRVDGKAYGINTVGGMIGSCYQVTQSTDNFSQTIVTRLSGAASKNTAFGAFVGSNRNSAFCRNYALGSVHYEDAIDPTTKGFAGYATGQSMTRYLDENNFFDMETSGQTTSAGSATGKTTAEMKKIATFTDLRTLGLGRPLAGTVSVAALGMTVTGTGTTFTNKLVPGQWIRLRSGINDAVIREVDTILDNTSLTVTQPFDQELEDVAIYHVAETDRWDMQARHEDLNEGYPWLTPTGYSAWSIYVRPQGTVILVH